MRAILGESDKLSDTICDKLLDLARDVLGACYTSEEEDQDWAGSDSGSVGSGLNGSLDTASSSYLADPMPAPRSGPQSGSLFGDASSYSNVDTLTASRIPEVSEQGQG